MSVSIIKIGDRRRGQKIFKKGEVVDIEDEGMRIYFDEDTVVPTVEAFSYLYPSIKKDLHWKTIEHLWNEAHPPIPVEMPVAPGGVSRSSWWSRLWGRSNLPKATVVNG